MKLWAKQSLGYKDIGYGTFFVSSSYMKKLLPNVTFCFQ